MRIGYTVQKLQSQIENLNKENGALRRNTSSSLSLRKFEEYARNNLSLGEPREVRFIKKKPLVEKKKTLFPFFKKGSWIRRVVDEIMGK
ncbi:hypothetical protein J7K55_08545 [Candidatus Aerophobetes bacterium]|nr:hypothetical protein [Candidatus Aerophobetes bacterium]